MYEEAGDDSDDPQCGEHAEPRDEEVPGRAEGVHVRGLGGRLGPSLSAQGDHDYRQAREQLPRGRGVGVARAERLRAPHGVADRC